MDKGTRVVELDPVPSTDSRWHGYVEGDEKQRRWDGKHCESVIGRMNTDLGPISDDQYVIVEGGQKAE